MNPVHQQQCVEMATPRDLTTQQSQETALNTQRPIRVLEQRLGLIVGGCFDARSGSGRP